MNIGIIGGGTVGRATAHVWKGYCDEVCVYDLMPERSTHKMNDVIQCGILFVCLPETELDNFFSLHHRYNWGIVNTVIRSTVPIGTTRRLANQYKLSSVCHSPEFLTERTVLIDAVMPARNIIGLPGQREDDECGKILYDLLKRRFPGVPIHEMTSDESEAVKLFCNAFATVKISFFNEIRTLADKIGMSWETVLAAMLAGGMISPTHTQVPGPDSKRGWGGRCLGKDLDHLIKTMTDAKTYPTVCEAARARNAVFDRGRQ